MSAAYVYVYVYDSEDRRMVKTTDRVATRTPWAGTEPVAQYDTNGALLRLIIPDGSGVWRPWQRARCQGPIDIRGGAEVRWQLCHRDRKGGDKG